MVWLENEVLKKTHIFPATLEWENFDVNIKWGYSIKLNSYTKLFGLWTELNHNFVACKGNFIWFFEIRKCLRNLANEVKMKLGTSSTQWVGFDLHSLLSKNYVTSRDSCSEIVFNRMIKNDMNSRIVMIWPKSTSKIHLQLSWNKTLKKMYLILSQS